ncbi:MAG: CsbD family protein, partial [Vicinamibacteria bacterium]
MYLVQPSPLKLLGSRERLAYLPRPILLRGPARRLLMGALEVHRPRGDFEMAGKTEELKGRVKEAAGVLTGDESLKKEGQLDQASGQIKQAAEK